LGIIEPSFEQSGFISPSVSIMTYSGYTDFPKYIQSTFLQTTDSLPRGASAPSLSSGHHQSVDIKHLLPKKP
jgi:hypothetical protein